jgi:hypothetical protein
MRFGASFRSNLKQSYMKTLLVTTLLSILFLSFGSTSTAQDETARVIWQVRSFDINANLQEAERSLNATATLNATNVGTTAGTTLTFRLNSKASVKTASVAGASAIFRSFPEKGELQRVTITLPTSVAPNAAVSITVNYVLPVESNTGLAAISPVSSPLLGLTLRRSTSPSTHQT